MSTNALRRDSSVVCFSLPTHSVNFFRVVSTCRDLPEAFGGVPYKQAAACFIASILGPFLQALLGGCRFSLSTHFGDRSTQCFLNPRQLIRLLLAAFTCSLGTSFSFRKLL